MQLAVDCPAGGEKNEAVPNAAGGEGEKKLCPMQLAADCQEKSCALIYSFVNTKRDIYSVQFCRQCTILSVQSVDHVIVKNYIQYDYHGNYPGNLQHCSRVRQVGP